MSLPNACPGCGNESGMDRAFVDYDPAPNDAQADTEWGNDLPPLKAIVCQDCGEVILVFDPGEIGNENRESRFRISEELE